MTENMRKALDALQKLYDNYCLTSRPTKAFLNESAANR